MTWTWKKGRASLATIDQSPAHLCLTTGYDTTPATIPRINPSQPFCTLGVHISPSGSQKPQATLLRKSSEKFYSSLSPSSLSPEEAYWSYMLYLCPKLMYPLGCSSFTQKQCRTIQAPALAALLPKLHLNRHTPHAFVFGPLSYGGMALPDLYVDQSYTQLRLFYGHLKLHDELVQLL